MCCISDAQRNVQSVSYVFIGICIAYVEFSYCNHIMEVVVTYNVPHPPPSPPL